MTPEEVEEDGEILPVFPFVREIDWVNRLCFVIAFLIVILSVCKFLL